MLEVGGRMPCTEASLGSVASMLIQYYLGDQQTVMDAMVLGEKRLRAK